MKRDNTLIRKKYREYFISTFALTMSIYAATIVDGIMVGRFLGSNALSVITLTSPVVYLKNIVLTLFVHGGTTLCAQLKGRRDEARANKVFTLAIAFGCLFSAIMVLLGLALATPTARLLSQGTELYGQTLEYLIPLWLNGPLILFVNGMASFVRIEGRHRLAMALPIVSNVINLILDAVFMNVFHMGIAGAGWATVVGYAAGALLLIPYFASRDRSFRFTRLRLADVSLLGETFHTGMASAAIHLCKAVAVTVINSIILRTLGVLGANVLSVCGMALMIGNMFVDGAATTLLPIGGALYGERDQNGLARLFRIALSATLAISFALLLVFELFPGAVSRLFSLKSPEAAAMFPAAFRLYITCIPCYGLTFILRAFYQSTGHRTAATVLTLLEGLIVIVPLMLLLSRLQPKLLWLSYTLSELISVLIVVLMMQAKAKKQGKTNFLMLDAQEGRVLELTTDNTPEGAVKASEAVMDFCRGSGVESATVKILGITVEELCLNAFTYALKGKSTYSDLFVRVLDESLVLKCRDNGSPFNPTEYINDSGEQITGIEMVRTLSSDIAYNRVIGFNVTLVTINR